MRPGEQSPVPRASLRGPAEPDQNNKAATAARKRHRRGAEIRWLLRDDARHDLRYSASGGYDARRTPPPGSTWINPAARCSLIYLIAGRFAKSSVAGRMNAVASR